MTNNEILFKACNNLGRYINIPGIYRHFKETKDGEDMIYAVSAVSIPTSKDFLREMILDNNAKAHYFNHTEKETLMPIYRLANNYYHLDETESEILVIYTAMYGDRKTYIRPLPMFVSKTDKEKYPNASQRYRLQLIKD